MIAIRGTKSATKALIMDVLQASVEPLPLHIIALGASFTPPHVHTMLSELIREGRVTKPSRGMYAAVKPSEVES